jgi:hypothetical protein
MRLRDSYLLNLHRRHSLWSDDKNLICLSKFYTVFKVEYFLTRKVIKSVKVIRVSFKLITPSSLLLPHLLEICGMNVRTN